MKQYILIPKVCPICGGATEIETSASGTQILICTNTSCDGKLINRLDHYCSKKGMDIKGLSKATLEKLIDWGWINDLVDLYNLARHRNEWVKKVGFGDKSVDKILQAIEDSKNCTLNSFIAALGIPLIGSTVAKDLAQHFKCWSKFRNAIDEKYKFSHLPNFGYEMENSILSYDWVKADELITKGNLFIQNVLENPVKSTTTSLANMIVVITGKLIHYKNRDALKAEIEQYGGKVASAISSKTSILINNDSASTSSKNKAAIDKGIPIMTEEEFIQKFFS